MASAHAAATSHAESDDDFAGGLARFACGLSGAVLPSAAVAAAQANLFDTLACAAAGSSAPAVGEALLLARGSLQWIDHPDLGRVVLPSSPLVFEGVPGQAVEPSRPLGSGNAEVVGDWLGHSPDEVAALRRDGVIGPQ